MEREDEQRLFGVLRVALMTSLGFGLIAVSGSFSSAHGGIGVVVMSFLPLLVFVPIVMLPASLFFMLWRRTRSGGLQMFVLGVAWLVSGLGSLWLERPIRRHVFERVASEGEPLIDALHAYQQDHSSPAPDLKRLVPAYLPKVPKTGLYEFSDFDYSADLEAQSWELSIGVSSGILNWDRFVYWSGEDYPEELATARVERVGRWAYLHE